MIESSDMYVKQTIQWIQTVVIQLNLCPFAKQEMDKGLVRVITSTAKTLDDAMSDLMVEMKHLDSHTDIDTTLLVFPFCMDNFLEYIDFVDIAESSIQQYDYEGIYQLASFHPHYCFAGVAPDDVSNYTNRSPYPMLHLLREEQLEKAIDYYGDTTRIPENNIACLRALGIDKVRQMLHLINHNDG